ncbi:hypothetical protein [Malikia spinosa]|uniref:hypothetical protein n=1 Tax=Malikia spinosa TaxID=86180 RepID=UPI002FD90519
MEFEFDELAMSDLIRRSRWRCEISGIHFEFAAPTQRGPHRPFAPSLDRIDSNIGYIKSNVRLVCLAVNLAMNRWGVEVLEKISAGIMGAMSKSDGYIPKKKKKSIIKKEKKPGKLLTGVRVTSKSRFKTRYQARVGSVSFGYFDSEMDAHLAYLRAKKEAIYSRQPVPKQG